jgi:hypothetical protein
MLGPTIGRALVESARDGDVLPREHDERDEQRRLEQHADGERGERG